VRYKNSGNVPSCSSLFRAFCLGMQDDELESESDRNMRGNRETVRPLSEGRTWECVRGERRTRMARLNKVIDLLEQGKVVFGGGLHLCRNAVQGLRCLV
jgi:hypothetical protein